jgi:polysaccharide pyruvyl transferase WcaK-like protein
MTPNPRLLLIADIGGERARHIGDEAMLEANLGALRELFPQASFTIVARDPGWVCRRYGVAAIPAAGSEAVASCDAVILSGGGNLSSSWPELLHERIALLELAHRGGKPAVVLGQTLGPQLSAGERQSLAVALQQARFVGVRELPSALLAIELGVPHERIWYQFDDALRIDELLCRMRRRLR